MANESAFTGEAQAVNGVADGPLTRDEVDRQLMDGGELRVYYVPGVSGAMGEDGCVSQDPEPAEFIADLTNRDGDGVAVGYGETSTEALAKLSTAPVLDPVALVAEGPF